MKAKPRVFFELNGQPRTERVVNRSAHATTQQRAQADSDNPCHIGAPMPGVISFGRGGGGRLGESGRYSLHDRGDENGRQESTPTAIAR